MNGDELEQLLRRRDPDRASRELLRRRAVDLYDVILREACAYIVDITSRLPTFGSQAAIELLKRQNALQELITTALEQLPVPDASRAPESQASRFDLLYRRFLAQTYDRVDLYGADLLPIDRRYSLESAYITLSAALTGSTESLPRPQRVDDLLGQHQRLHIIGEAGSGKTTVLQWLVVQLCRRQWKPQSAQAVPTPFVIPLRRWVSGSLPSPEEFVLSTARVIGHLMPPQWVHNKLQQGHAYILIDGLDELPSGRRGAFATWLDEMMSVYPDCFYVITSRPLANGWHSESWGFARVELLPMSSPDITAFVEYWYRAVTMTVDPTPTDDEVARFSTEVLNNIRLNGAVRRLAKNPLLCALLCSLIRERRATLPHDRVQLYKIALDMLLARRDVERDVIHAPPAPLPDLLLFVQDLAHWLVSNDRSEVQRESVLDRFERRRSMMPHSSPTPVELLRYFEERAGLLREPTPGTIDFTHRSFQEFLAAQEAIDQDNIGLLSRFASGDDWHEVVILAAGLGNVLQRENILLTLISLGDADRSQRTKSYLLAANCLAVVRSLPTEIIDRVRSRVSTILPPATRDEALAISVAGDLCIPLVMQLPWRELPLTSQASCIALLGYVGGDTGLHALRSIAGMCGSELEAELLSVWGEFDANEYAQQVLSVAQIGDHLVVPTLEQAQAGSELASVRRVTYEPTMSRSVLEVPVVPKLVEIRVRDDSALTEVNFCPGEHRTVNLTFTRCRNLSLLNGLENCRWLRAVSMPCSGVVSLDMLASATGLTDLDMRETEVRELGPLEGLANLRALDLRGAATSADEVCRFARELPSVVVTIARYLAPEAEDVTDVDLPENVRIDWIHA